MSRARRIRLLLAVTSMALCAAPTADAQQGIGRVAWVHSGTETTGRTSIEILRKGLRSHGQVEGRTFRLDVSYVEGRVERYAPLLDEVVREGADVILVGGYQGTLAAKNSTSRIPVVGIGCGIELLVESLARPGGNVTGLTCQSVDLAKKQMQVLREALPGVRRIALVYNASTPYTEPSVRELRPLAKFGADPAIELTFASPAEFPGIVKRLRDAHAGAVFVVPDLIVFGNRHELMRLLLAGRLPAMTNFSDLAEAGALMSYGASLGALIERASWFVDRILRGANPADLPMEQPTRFELAVNLKTAQALGVALPASVLLRADRVIE